jgi:Asparagine synthase
VASEIGQQLALSPLEVAAGVVLGLAPEAGPAPATARRPVEALEAAVLPAVTSEPCLVSFSGGIDSSLVLAAAVRMARRHGLQPPVPLTWRFSGAPRSDEHAWQERVVAELGLSDWERIEAGDELDLVGPQAQALLRQDGLRYPPNRHFHAALLQRARGGALLTGVGGDQVMGPGRWRQAARVLAAARVPTPRGIAHLAVASAPPSVRTRLDPRRLELESPWLQPAAAREAAVRFAAARASEPMRWDARARWQPRRGDLAAQISGLEELATAAGARLVLPLMDPGFIEAVARGGRWRGFPDRLTAVKALLGEVVPSAVLERRRKAAFGEAFWRSPARDLARDWDGDGVDPGLVDVPALRSIWRRPELPPFRTALLVQQVWLSRMASCGSGGRA